MLVYIYTHEHNNITYIRPYCNILYFIWTCIHILWITHFNIQTKTLRCDDAWRAIYHFFVGPLDISLIIIIQNFNAKAHIQLAMLLKPSEHFIADYHLSLYSSFYSLIMTSIIYFISLFSKLFELSQAILRDFPYYNKTSLCPYRWKDQMATVWVSLIIFLSDMYFLFSSLMLQPLGKNKTKQKPICIYSVFGLLS